ncbi:unnamed protein product [Bursaphelenchus okinawaensis]|uniref:Uncharacterized protein n=1 Tax=Bursaphelenchus okinawaensis TaxID=465554 RepID=A0A811JTH5_9BILA|nr:unnamed protein product [Bursaphelenchus okinawaensis]CAG9081775.1 unnamed protein product [Bursaphelenchus okinawaensis]
MDNWSQIWYLYAFPQSDRLKNALVDGSIDRVFTTPVLRHEQPLKDDLVAVADKLKVQKKDHVEYPNTKEGLKVLIKAGKLKAAFNLTTQLLVKMGHVPNAHIRRNACTPESLEIWNCRFQLLMALEMHSVLKEEMAAFNELDAPDLYFEFRSVYRRLEYVGSVVPFQLRLIHAEVPRFSDNPEHVFSRLGKLEENTKTVLAAMEDDMHKSVWEKRLEAVQLVRARALYHLKDYMRAIQVYEDLLSRVKSTEKHNLISNQLTRISMIVGHSKFFEKAVSLNKSSAYHHNKGLRAIFAANYQKALDCFTSAKAEDQQETCEICNNKAICELYTGGLKEAVTALNSHPKSPLPLMRNLYTIGDLASTNSAELRTQHFVKHCNSLSDLYDPTQLRVL